MLSIRAARQSALRLARSSAAARVELESTLVPHAESSSAPFRRHVSSSPASPLSQEGQVVNKSSSKNRNDKARPPNPRLKRQALANAKKLADAMKSQQTPSIASPNHTGPQGSSSVNVDTSSSSDSSFWSDLLVRPESFDRTASRAANNVTPSSTSPPTLDDLLSKKPTRDPLEPWHPRYTRQYNRVYHSIDSAFVLSQMRAFAKELNVGVGGRTRTNKGLIVRKIMKSWGWVEPRPKPVERPPEPRVFDLPASELFLFLRDNELVQSFAQGDEPIELSVVPSSQAPQSPFYTPKPDDEGRMVLVATGKDAQLNTLNAALKERKASIKTVTFAADEVHGLRAPVGLLQVVSNAAGAYVEPLADNSYRVTAMSEEDGEVAKQLLRLAAFRTDILASTRSLNAVLPVPPHFLATHATPKFALYPFSASLTEPLEWDQAAKAHAHSLFRLRKVGQWTTKPAVRELDQKEESVQNGEIRGLIVTPPKGQKGEQATLQGLIGGLTGDEAAEIGEKTLKVTYGHLLFPVTPKDGRLGTWDSPIPGQWPIATAENWLAGREDRRPFFAPSLTPATVQFPLSGSTRQIRRLRYRTVPSPTSTPGQGTGARTKFASFTFTQLQAPVEPEAEAEAPQDGKWQDELGELLDKLEKELENENKSAEDGGALQQTETESARDVELDKEQEGHAPEEPSGDREIQAQAVQEDISASTTPITAIEEDTTVDSETETPIPETEVTIQAEYGTLKELDLLCPDRPCDARIVSTSSSELSEIPESITAMFRAHVEGAPERPPTAISVDGEQYELEVNESAEVTEEVDEVITRTVKTTDEGLNGHGRYLVYTEVELPSGGEGISEAFYKALATITRDIGPDASALKSGGSGSLFASLKGWEQGPSA